MDEIRLCGVGDAAAMAQFYQENAEHLQRWEPLRGPRYHSQESWTVRLAQWVRLREEGRAVNFVTLQAGRIVAVCNLTNIVGGVFQAGYLGYAVAADQQGQGVMHRLCRHVVDYAFDVVALNRIMANYMPANARSERLLQRLGFEREGMAKRYLYINGQWEDHVLTALLNPAVPFHDAV